MTWICVPPNHPDQPDWHAQMIARPHQDVAIVNPGQFLLALELYLMEAVATAARFDRDVLEDIQATVSLEPGTAARVAEAQATLTSEKET